VKRMNDWHTGRRLGNVYEYIMGGIVIRPLRRMRVGLCKQRVSKSIGMFRGKLREDCEDLVAPT
jgi:hypothetical protein